MRKEYDLAAVGQRAVRHDFWLRRWAREHNTLGEGRNHDSPTTDDKAQGKGKIRETDRSDGEGTTSDQAG